LCVCVQLCACALLCAAAVQVRVPLCVQVCAGVLCVGACAAVCRCVLSVGACAAVCACVCMCRCACSCVCMCVLVCSCCADTGVCACFLTACPRQERYHRACLKCLLPPDDLLTAAPHTCPPIERAQPNPHPGVTNCGTPIPPPYPLPTSGVGWLATCVTAIRGQCVLFAINGNGASESGCASGSG
jgi:hypothetical protein